MEEWLPELWGVDVISPAPDGSGNEEGFLLKKQNYEKGMGIMVEMVLTHTSEVGYDILSPLYYCSGGKMFWV